MFETVTPGIAKKIMGQNFCGVKTAIKFGWRPSSGEDLRVFDAIPFSRRELHRCRGTHVLVFHPKLPLDEIYDKALARDQKSFYEPNTWWRGQKLTEGGFSRWRLIRKSPAPNSVGKSWGEQEKLSLNGEIILPASAAVYAAAVYFFSTGERLFMHPYVRCADTRVQLAGDGGPKEVHVYVGFGKSGIFVSGYCGDEASPHIGLAVERLTSMAAT